MVSFCSVFFDPSETRGQRLRAGELLVLDSSNLAAITEAADFWRTEARHFFPPFRIWNHQGLFSLNHVGLFASCWVQRLKTGHLNIRGTECNALPLFWGALPNMAVWLNGKVCQSCIILIWTKTEPKCLFASPPSFLFWLRNVIDWLPISSCRQGDSLPGGGHTDISPQYSAKVTLMTDYLRDATLKKKHSQVTLQ